MDGLQELTLGMAVGMVLTSAIALTWYFIKERSRIAKSRKVRETTEVLIKDTDEESA